VSAAGSARAQTWGWHRLDPTWAQQLVADAHIRPGDLVLDVGAGTGAVTAPLVDAGARVIAVELHPRRYAALQEAFSGAPVRVVRADAADLRLPRRPFRVVANPPFGVISALLHRLLAPGSRLVSADLVVPTSVARRWSQGRAPGAGRWQRAHRLTVSRPVPRRAFTPPPSTSCAVLTIRRR
jgi:23S rRNA (adenine-N6)-dimethyltransferase